MIGKHPIVANRVRTVTAGFSWIDHRLVREHFIERFSHAACALYLFLVTVADAKGLSHYADPSLQQRLGMDQATLEQAAIPSTNRRFAKFFDIFWILQPA